MTEAWPSALHVIDAGSPGSGLVAVRLAAAVAAVAGGSQRILFLGPARDLEAAAATVTETGAPPSTLLAGPCPPLGDPTLAVRPLRRAIAAVEREHGRFDRLVGWGTAPSLATALAMPGRVRCTISTVGAIADRRLARLARAGRGGFACLSEEASRSFVAACPAFGPIVELPMPPGAVAPPGDRAAIRAGWEVADATIVVGVLADHPRWCDLKHAIDAVGFAAAAGVPSLLVVSPRSARLAPSREWTRTLRSFTVPGLGGGDPRLWIADPRLDRPWSVVAGLDAAFIPGDGIATAGAAAFADRVGAVDRLLGRLAAADTAHRPRAVPTSPLPALCAAAAGVPVLSERDDRVAPSREVMALADDRSALDGRVSAARGWLAAVRADASLTRWRDFLAAG